ncbi:kinase-like domain-containing protein [Rhodocollybia butyracea]|uniref:1-phosphatidylinositol 4-kinase n=1 Tax=Rhodocollybia butyracea TaxID=206335 RepID=A0A9P5PW35_9AGAR|nr:kinase-like domain-containing protein [Rhodocollybia butyracea]
MITLWFMQAALKDLSSSPHRSPSFVICQRVLHKCHEIIFGDLPTPVIPYPSITVPFRSLFPRKKIKAHMEPAIVGIGMVLAGSPGMPRLTDIMGQVSVEQGRVEDSEIKSIESEDSDEDGISPIPSPPSPDDSEDQEEPSTLLARRRGPAQTVPALPLHLHGLRRSRHSQDPLGQLDAEQLTQRMQTESYQSSPSISSARATPFRTNHVDALLANYDLASQVHLLKGHYCRSEVQFILSLENISNRLLVVPRPARVSALRAELTSLNHKLPAEVCMPMWCDASSDSDTALHSSSSHPPHHRIVRIPPGESVVLNSAERAPYLLYIEILNGDLDFDPSKRANKDVLRKIVVNENGNKDGRENSLPPPVSRRTKSHSDSLVPDSDVLGGTSTTTLYVPPTSPSASTSPADNEPEPEEEEMDLVEQLYGPSQSLLSHPIDLSESIVLPPPPKNKDLDRAAWGRAKGRPESRDSSVPSSVHGSPSLDNQRKEGRIPPPLKLHPEFNNAILPNIINTNTNANSTSSPNTINPNAISLDEYSERMRTAAIMLAQLNANLLRGDQPAPQPQGSALPDTSGGGGPLSWIPGSSWLSTPTSGVPNVGNSQNAFSSSQSTSASQLAPQSLPNRAPALSLAPAPAPVPTLAPQAIRMRLQLSEASASAIRDRIMQEMLALEEERMAHMRENTNTRGWGLGLGLGLGGDGLRSGGEVGAEDEGIIRRELGKEDPSAMVFSESWAAKKSRIRHGSPYGHLANWDCVSVIVKTGGDLRQEQLAVQLIHEFQRIWEEESCQCWVRYFRILITGGSSGLVETITDAVSIHSMKKSEYARRLAQGQLGHVTLFDHFKSTYGDPSSAKFARAQRNFAKSLAGYSIITYLLQIKDRHNGNILLDRDGHLIHIDFGFMLSNTPGNIRFEAAPFKLPVEYIEVLGGIDGAPFLEFRRLFREGFEAARKHCDRIITMVELMQKDSTLPCFAAFGEQTAAQLRDRFQPALTHSLVGELVDRLIDTSLGSHWTRLYDSYQYYSQSIL